MTATPIPRTLSLTLYGDLDISLIDEMPPQKKPIRTVVFAERQRKALYDMVRHEVEEGHQVFIVYPLIEASENIDLKDASRMAGHLQDEIFPDYRIGLIHGRMKRSEQETVMDVFGRGKIHLLVATSLIEVGIDIPSASLIIIEHAERFGLSQLHQLRGRVGRGDIPSVCILMACLKTSDKALHRLRIMEETNDGFRIAEEDLAMRGPGEMMGVRQSGLPDFRIADIRRDAQLLNEARQDAFSLIETDPCLDKPEHRALRDELNRRSAKKLALSNSG
jgi:ATP-dependent DNA helicase RecG